MINRVLIRIKVVQMLYSYLLTEKHFSLEPQPDQPTKEKRFAYKIYLDTLSLMVEIANLLGRKTAMSANRFINALEGIDKIKAILARQSHGEVFEFIYASTRLADEVKNSGIYKLYIRKGGDDSLVSDVKVWKELFEHIIWPSAIYREVVTGYDNYSLRGMDRMYEMMQNTFTNFMSSHGGITDAIKQLNVSLNASRELYFRLLLLPVAIADLRMQQIDAGRAKRLPTAEDLNPDMRLVESPLLDMIRENVTVSEYAEEHNISWLTESPAMIESLLHAVMQNPRYEEYRSTDPSVQADYNFWRIVLPEIITTNEAFLEEMESKSVFWNDDIDIMTEFAIKTMRRLEEGMGQNAMLAMYKDEDDARFGRSLFKLVVDNKEDYRTVINECVDTKIWEAERLAYMDVIILITAMAEMLNFPTIPLKVTVNEYIEIAKSYSTPKSGAFVNGLLGQIIARLRQERKLLKTDTAIKK